MNIELIKHIRLISIALLVIFIQTVANAQTIFETIRNDNYVKAEQMIHENKGLVDSINSGYSPLLYASVLGKDSIVNLLLQNGANINYKNSGNGWEAVHYTVAANKISTLRLLIDNGANLNNLTNDNKTALHLATYYSHYDLCSFLVANKCKLNGQDTSGNTALHTAIELKSDRISKFLINAGADFNLPTNKKKSAIILAIENNSHEIVDLLQQKGAELPKDKELMNELLHSAVLNGFQDILEELVMKGADLTSLDNKGRNLLHNAAISGNLAWVTKLVDMGWNINKTDYTNRTAATLANDWGYSDVAKFLKTNGGVLSKPNIVEITGAAKSEIKVTYIANMGFLVSSASKTVMIDALFGTSSSYLYPSTVVLDKINKLNKPFESVDLMLLTHTHPDHFSAPMVAEYLMKNSSVEVICNQSALLELNEIENCTVDTSRIVGLTPDLYKSIDTTVNNIDVKILRLRHTGDNGRTENLGFLFNLDGVKILHVGDATGRVSEQADVSGIEEFDSLGFKNLDIDIAILNRGSLWGEDAPGIEIIKKYIKPKHIILGHFSIGNKDGEDEVYQTIEKLKDSLPGVTILEESMQNIIINKS
ncbi:MAG: ankyrin repeat domain-containing protein [Candidatus Tenebribacter davisii]|nr:ankyrin repeat domain-containing protein [Candidatus Tenebribacter davisii]